MLNSVANLPHSHESSHVQPFFCLPLWESNWKWIGLSHCHLTSRSCLKDTPHSSWTQPSLSLTRSQGWKTCWVLCFWRAVISRSCHTGGFALCAPVYPSKLKCLLKCHYFRSRKFLTKIQALSLNVFSQTGGDIQSLKKQKLCNNKAPFVGSLFFLVHSKALWVLRKRPEKCTWGLLDISLKAFWCYEWA